ncbi:MAG: peptidoglycan DD-metalloendopeptidase family protein [Pyrinomonadaceae bacterium]
MLSSARWILCLLVLLPAFVFAQRGERSSKSFGGGAAPDISDSMTDEKRAEIQQGLAENIARLKAEGKLERESPQAVGLNWPVRKVNFNDNFIDGISNYVDQNPANPGAILDWNCSNRTYDLSGYNHGGIDIFTWPFGWLRMDTFQAEVVAAAAGTIIQKADGNFDRNCAMGGGNPNMIFIRHSDGSVAWYLHMKANSLTSKGVGDTVAQGEFLGVIGSSGSSTGPHLHFELYNASNQLQEPYQGACNNMNASSWWNVQEPYRNTRINALMTGSAAPVMPACPTQEVPNAQSTFAPGATIFMTAFYRDQLTSQQTTWEIVRPDGSIHATWTHTSPNTYSASWWWYSLGLPASPLGTWRVRLTSLAQTVDQPFILGTPTNALVTLSGRVRSNSGRGIGRATVTLTNTSTGATVTAITGKNGQYSFSNIAAGVNYTVTASQRRHNFGSAVRAVIPVENTTGLEIMAR